MSKDKEIKEMSKVIEQLLDDGYKKRIPLTSTYLAIELSKCGYSGSFNEEITKLEEEIAEQKKVHAALIYDVKTVGYKDICDICKNNDSPLCEFECNKCNHRCKCKSCDGGSEWEWRGYTIGKGKE